MRTPTKNLRLMTILHPRMRFTSKQEKLFSNAKSGFDGECAANARRMPC